MTYNVLLEKLLKDVGGCGKFQWMIAVVVSFSIITECWTMLHMSFMGQEPNFFCLRNNTSQKQIENSSDQSQSSLKCSASNASDCDRYQFDDEIVTVVSEWSLVCDREWIVATITTLQMAGVLIGCFIAGQIGDWFGRKPSYYFSIAFLVGLNIIAYFSVSWQMYATVRFCIGIGLGFCISNQLNFVCEFLTSIWRPVYIAFPTWATMAGAFALLAWACKDWKKIHLASAVIGAPFLLSWWMTQESFRWLITKGRYKEAGVVINKIASINGRPGPDITEIVEQAKLEDATSSKFKYSVLDLFKTRQNIIKTIALLFIWSGMSYAYYGLTFGIQNMAGDLYFNMFLSNIIEIPANFITIYICNRFGRKKWCIISYFFTGLCGVGNGILQNIGGLNSGILLYLCKSQLPDNEVSRCPSSRRSVSRHNASWSEASDHKHSHGLDVLVNVFALGSRLGLAAGWTAQAVMTVEQYPTVIRGTAYGLANTSARIGGMIAPQIVFLNNHIPGILFFISAAVMIVSSMLCFLFTETKDRDLEDTLSTSERKMKSITVENNTTIDEKVKSDNSVLVTKF